MSLLDWIYLLVTSHYSHEGPVAPLVHIRCLINTFRLAFDLMLAICLNIHRLSRSTSRRGFRFAHCTRQCFAVVTFSFFPETWSQAYLIDCYLHFPFASDVTFSCNWAFRQICGIFLSNFNLVTKNVLITPFCLCLLEPFSFGS